MARTTSTGVPDEIPRSHLKRGPPAARAHAARLVGNDDSAGSITELAAWPTECGILWPLRCRSPDFH